MQPVFNRTRYDRLLRAFDEAWHRARRTPDTHEQNQLERRMTRIIALVTRESDRLRRSK